SSYLVLLVLHLPFFFLMFPSLIRPYLLSLHDALPIWGWPAARSTRGDRPCWRPSTPARTRSRSSSAWAAAPSPTPPGSRRIRRRSEEHTSELQSLAYLVCRLLLEKKKSNCCIS